MRPKVPRAYQASILFLLLTLVLTVISATFTAIQAEAVEPLRTISIIMVWIPVLVSLFLLVLTSNRGTQFTEPIEESLSLTIISVCADEFIWPGKQFLRFEDLDSEEYVNHRVGQSEPGYSLVYQVNEGSLAVLAVPQALTKIQLIEQGRPHVLILERTIYLQDMLTQPAERIAVHDRRHYGYILYIPEEWLSDL